MAQTHETDAVIRSATANGNRQQIDFICDARFSVLRPANQSVGLRHGHFNRHPSIEQYNPTRYEYSQRTYKRNNPICWTKRPNGRNQPVPIQPRNSRQTISPQSLTTHRGFSFRYKQGSRVLGFRRTITHRERKRGPKILHLRQTHSAYLTID